jgi:hypothetical protein
MQEDFKPRQAEPKGCQGVEDCADKGKATQQAESTLARDQTTVGGS